MAVKKKFILIFIILCVLLAAVLLLAKSAFFQNLILRYQYPLSYRDYIVQYSAEYQLDPSLVSAVIYEESRFRPSSSSSKGAVGLMQILPETSDYIAQKIEGQRFDYQSLSQPEKNIKYGCYYLSYLQKKYGDIDKVLAAYNAGEGNVDQWIAEGDFAIKFGETRNFVDRVLKTETVYQKLYFSTS